MFDPRHDALDREGADGRARVYEDRERGDLDPRDGLMRDLDLPRGEERELVAVRDRVYELDGEESRTLAAVGAFRVVPEQDLGIDYDTLDHLRDEGLVETVDLGDDEHWIPRGLGSFRGYTPLADRLCPECNARLGQLDQELMRTGPTGFHRALLGIEGRHGPPKVSPFQYKAMQADQPTKMMMPALGREHEVLAEAYTDEEGRHSARPLRQVVLKMPDGRMECVPFPRGWNAGRLKTAVTNRGLEGGTPEEIYLEDDEDGSDQDSPYMREVRTILSAVFGSFRAQAYGGPGERTHNRLATVSGINLIYLRGVAKVAFHYFLWACPVLNGHESAFEPVRTFIHAGAGDWREFVQIDAPQFLPLLREGHVPARTSHFFYAALTKQQATAHVQFFVGPHGLPPPCRVKLATNPLAIEGKDFACHQACYFDDDADRADGHDGELVAIAVWERRIVRP